jgi:hypothetical protein
VEFLGWEWPDGSPEVAAAIDDAVADLVDKMGIVPADRRNSCMARPGLRGLRQWLEYMVVGYFDLTRAIESEPTGSEVRRHQRRIARLGDRLCKELAELYSVIGCAIPGDLAAVERAVARTQGHLVIGDYPTRKSNASKDAVHVLSRHICFFWQPGVSGPYSPLDLAMSSDAVRFARYIFRWLGEGRSDRMTVERLRTAEREIATGRLGEG